MDALAERLPDIITAAAQSYLGIFALLSVALSLLAYFFFSKASEKVKVGIFVLLFFGVISFGVAMFRVSDTAPPEQTPVALSKEAQRLLKEAAADSSGLILFEHYGAGVDLHTNGVSFVTSKADRRELALWEFALQQLVSEGLLASKGDSGEVFEMTQQGYEAAKLLDQQTAESRN